MTSKDEISKAVATKIKFLKAVEEGETFHSEINDTQVKVVGVEGDKVRVSNGENEWWERMEDVGDKISDGAWEEEEEKTTATHMMIDDGDDDDDDPFSDEQRAAMDHTSN